MSSLKKKVSVLLCLVVLFQMSALTHSDGSVSLRLSSVEISQIEQIDENLSGRSELLELKRFGVLDDFIDAVASEKESYISARSQETLEQMGNWGISPTDTVAKVRQRAQDYLDANFDGTVIGSPEFYDLVTLYFDTDLMGTAKLADDLPGFGDLYVCMCIYHAFVISDGQLPTQPWARFAVDEENILNEVTILNLTEIDSEADFVSTRIGGILYDHLQAVTDNGHNTYRVIQTY